MWLFGDCIGGRYKDRHVQGSSSGSQQEPVGFEAKTVDLVWVWRKYPVVLNCFYLTPRVLNAIILTGSVLAYRALSMRLGEVCATVFADQFGL